MRSIAVLASALLLGCAPASPPVSPARPMVAPSPSMSYKTLDETVGAQAIRVILPSRPLAKPPLVVFFHSYGRDQTQISMTRLPRLLEEVGWLGACGDLGGREHWGNDRALESHRDLVQYMVREHRADPGRVYLVGFSMGAGAALLTAMEAPGLGIKVAGVAASQGWSSLQRMQQLGFLASIQAAYNGPPPADRELVNRAERLRGVRVYLEHGDADQVVPYTETARLHERLEALGIDHHYALHKGLGHTEATLHDRDILDFFGAL